MASFIGVHIQIIIGSVREGRMARAVGEWVYETAALSDDLSMEILDLKEWNLPTFPFSESPAEGNYADPLQRRWGEKVSRGDAYVFICPEYNHGYTAALKNALDYLYNEWKGKPALIVGYGGMGGVRSAEQLKPVLLELQMMPLPESISIMNVWSKVKNEVFAPDEKDAERLKNALEHLLWWGHLLKKARLTPAP